MSIYIHILRKPAEELWFEQLERENILEWSQRELELDLARQEDLYPPTDSINPEVFPAEMLSTWQAYEVIAILSQQTQPFGC